MSSETHSHRHDTEPPRKPSARPAGAIPLPTPLPVRSRLRKPLRVIGAGNDSLICLEGTRQPARVAATADSLRPQAEGCSLSPGAVVDERYRIEAVIGRGGVGTVYRATDLLLDGPVALKILQPAFASDALFMNSLREEAKFALRLSHRNIVRLNNLYKSGETYYLVMEYVDGISLRQWLARQNPVPAETVADILRDCEPPLTYAHREGVLHNDLKPENVLVSQDGEIKIIDFGLASLAEARIEGVVVLGTPAYMSPERIRREPLDVRSDVYALGMIAYELLTGSLPFPEDLPATEIPNVQPQELTGVPPAIKAVLEKAIARSRADRWASIKAFVDAFRAALTPDAPGHP